MLQEVMQLSNRQRRSSAPTLQANPNALLRVLEDEKPISNALKDRFKFVFDKYEQLVKLCSDQITATRFKVKENSAFDPSADFLRKPETDHVRTFSPLELVATAILVSCHMKNRTDEELIEDVKALRIYLRIKHQDLRLNAHCWATVWRFIYVEMRVRRGLPAEEQSTDQHMDVGDGEGGDGELEDWDRPGSSGSSLTSAESTPEPSSPSNLGDDSDSDDMDEDKPPLPAIIAQSPPLDRPRRPLNNGNSGRVEEAAQETEESIEDNKEPIKTNDLKQPLPNDLTEDVTARERSKSSAVDENLQSPKMKDEVIPTALSESNKSVPYTEDAQDNKNKKIDQSTTPIEKFQAPARPKEKSKTSLDNLESKAIAIDEKIKASATSDEKSILSKDTKPTGIDEKTTFTSTSGEDSTSKPSTPKKASENPFVDSLVASIGAVKRPRPSSRKAPAPKKPRKE